MIQHSKNLFASAIEEEMKDLIDSYSGLDGEDVFPLLNNEGNVIIPIKSDPMIYGHRIDYTEDEDNDINYPDNMGTFYNLSHDLKLNQIMKIDATPDILKAFLLDIYASKDLSFYGCMISYGHCRYNPLHPIIANMIKKKEITLPDKFQLVVYEYSSKHGRSDEPLEEDIGLIMNLLGEIDKNSYQASTISSYRGNGRSLISRADDTDFMNSAFQFDMEDNARPRYAITPVQFMTDEVVMPYYGAIASYTSGGAYVSINLMPMFSCNIALDEENPSEAWSSTCTGSQPSNRFKSLYTLNDMNCSSVFHEYAFDGNYRDWAFACTTTSIFIMYQEDVKKIKEPEKEVIVETDIKEHGFNPSKSFKDWNRGLGTIESVSIEGPDSRRDELNNLSKRECYMILRDDLGVSGHSRTSKEDLMEAILKEEGYRDIARISSEQRSMAEEFTNQFMTDQFGIAADTLREAHEQARKLEEVRRLEVIQRNNHQELRRTRTASDLQSEAERRDRELQEQVRAALMGGIPDFN